MNFLNIDMIKRTLANAQPTILARHTGVALKTIHTLRENYDLESTLIKTLIKIQEYDKSSAPDENDELINLGKAEYFFKSNTPYTINKLTGINKTVIINIQKKGIGVTRLSNIKKILDLEHQEITVRSDSKKLNVSAIQRVVNGKIPEGLNDTLEQAILFMKHGNLSICNMPVCTLLDISSLEKKQYIDDETVDLSKARRILRDGSVDFLAEKYNIPKKTISALKNNGLEKAYLSIVYKLLAEKEINIIDLIKLKELLNSDIPSSEIAKKCELSTNEIDKIRIFEIEDMTIKSAIQLMKYFD